MASSVPGDAEPEALALDEGGGRGGPETRVNRETATASRTAVWARIRRRRGGTVATDSAPSPRGHGGGGGGGLEARGALEVVRGGGDPAARFTPRTSRARWISAVRRGTTTRPESTGARRSGEGGGGALEVRKGRMAVARAQNPRSGTPMAAWTAWLGREAGRAGRGRGVWRGKEKSEALHPRLKDAVHGSDPRRGRVGRTPAPTRRSAAATGCRL